MRPIGTWPSAAVLAPAHSRKRVVGDQAVTHCDGRERQDRDERQQASGAAQRTRIALRERARTVTPQSSWRSLRPPDICAAACRDRPCWVFSQKNGSRMSCQSAL